MATARSATKSADALEGILGSYNNLMTCSSISGGLRRNLYCIFKSFANFCRSLSRMYYWVDINKTWPRFLRLLHIIQNNWKKVFLWKSMPERGFEDILPQNMQCSIDCSWYLLPIYFNRLQHFKNKILISHYLFWIKVAT